MVFDYSNHFYRTSDASVYALLSHKQYSDCFFWLFEDDRKCMLGQRKRSTPILHLIPFDNKFQSEYFDCFLNNCIYIECVGNGVHLRFGTVQCLHSLIQMDAPKMCQRAPCLPFLFCPYPYVSWIYLHVTLILLEYAHKSTTRYCQPLFAQL
jgi:hypothetical protein